MTNYVQYYTSNLVFVGWDNRRVFAKFVGCGQRIFFSVAEVDDHLGFAKS